MVETTATVNVIANFKDNASRGINNLNRSVATTAKGGAKLKGGLSGAVKSLTGLSLGAVGAVAAVGALGTAVVKGVKDFAEFEKVIQNTATLISGDSTEAVKRFTKEVSRISTVVPKDKNDLGAGLYDILSAGISEADGALQFLEQSAKLATAGLADTSQSVDLMTSAFNAYKNEGLSAAEISDILFTTVKQGKTTIAKLSRSFGVVAPVANAAGVSFRELQAATAALTTQGIKTSEAQTGLKAAFSNIIKPQGEAAKLAKELGLEFNTTALQSKGLSGFLDSVKQATGGNIDTMAKLFGSVEGLNAVLALTSDEGGATFKATLDEINKATGSTEEAFKKQTQTLDAQWKLLKAGISNTLQPAFQGITTALTKALQGFQEFAAKAKTDPTLIAAWEGFKKVMQGIGGVLSAIFGNLKSLFTGFATAYKESIGTIFKENKGFETATGLLNKLKQAYASLKPIFQGVGKVLGDTIGTALRLVTGLWQGFYGTILKVIEPIKGMQGGLSNIGQSLGFLGEIVKFVGKILITTFRQAGETLGAIFGGAIKIVVGLFKGLSDGLKPVVDAFKGMKVNIDGNVKAINPMKVIFTALGKVLGAVAFVVGKVLGLAITGLVAILTGLVKVVIWVGKKVWENFKRVGEAFANVFNAVKNAFGSVKKFLTDVVNKILDKLGVVGDAIRKIIGFGKEVKDKVGGAFKKAGQGIKNFFSPKDATEPLKAANTALTKEVKKTEETAAAIPDKIEMPTLDDAALKQGVADAADYKLPEFDQSPFTEAVANGEVDAAKFQELEASVTKNMDSIGNSVTQNSKKIVTALLPVTNNFLPLIIEGFSKFKNLLSPLLRYTLDELQLFAKQFLLTFNVMNKLPVFMGSVINNTSKVALAGFHSMFNSIINITNSWIKQMVDVMQKGVNLMIAGVNKAIDQYNNAVKVLNKDVYQKYQTTKSYRDSEGNRRTRTVTRKRLLYGGLNLQRIDKVKPLNVEAPQGQQLQKPVQNNIDLGGMNINIEQFNSDDPADKQKLFSELETFMANKLQSVVRF